MVSGGLEKKRTNTNYPRDELELEEDGDSMNRILALWQDAEKASFLTHPALADISPTRPESAETASSPKTRFVPGKALPILSTSL